MAKREQVELSPETQERIMRGVRSLAEDRVDRGVDVSRPFRCDSCGEMKPGAGSTQYGAYKLCNDCLLDFTLSIAGNRVDSVYDFIRRDMDGQIAVSQEWSDPVDRQIPRPVGNRDKLMPRNEPC